MPPSQNSAEADQIPTCGKCHYCCGPLSFQDHLNAPRGLGALRDWPHTGAAGGAACGDLLRVAVRVEGERVAEAGFDAEGCGAARAAGSAVVELVEGRPFVEAARITPDRISDALGGLIAPKRHAATLAADALHRALGSAAKAGELTLKPSARRTLVAMSGGVDSSAAAQLALDAGDDVLAVTLELWSDPATDGELSCCSPQAVTGARELAHRMGHPAHHARHARSLPGRGGRFVRERVRRGAHTQPLRQVQRRGALRRDARAGAERWARAAWPPATTHASRATSAVP